MINQKNLTGFTLIEVMIVVAIIAILASIAIPAYNDQMRKSRRSEGRALLLDITSRQTRFYTAQSPNSYGSNLSTHLGYGANPLPSENGYYVVSVAATPVGCAPGGIPCSGFTLTAAVQIDRATEISKGCGDLTLDNLDNKGESGALTVSDCW